MLFKKVRILQVKTDSLGDLGFQAHSGILAPFERIFASFGV